MSAIESLPSLADMIRAGKRVVTVNQGECVFTNRSLLLCTTLGSCVAAAFRHRDSGHCAMFHAFWPSGGEDEAARPCRYVESAVEGVAARYRAEGIVLRDVEADVAGGAYTGDSPAGFLDVGRKNAQALFDALKRHGFRLCSLHTLGKRARTLFLDTDSGRTWLRTLPKRWRESASFLDAQPFSDGNSCRYDITP